MLMQSHSGEISLLPALPAEWPKGSVTGLRGRGGYTIDIRWDNGRLIEATLVSDVTQTCRLRIKEKLRVLKVIAGKKYKIIGG
ncbi:glycoside hydrolase family 95-like protein [Puia sp. P3]|uniref:glycoside hydrolase family 95-like protein n=1 Tax=Puia sp. P3 TaxID=3423952 RepID=UPI003D669185